MRNLVKQVLEDPDRSLNEDSDKEVLENPNRSLDEESNRASTSQARAPRR